MTRTLKTRLASVIVLTAALALSGCGREDVTGPTSTQFSGTPIVLPMSERPSAGPGSELQDLPSVTVLVSAENGGVVRMGRYTLTFPPGALASDTPITITQADPAAMIVELQPHGTQFMKPVTFSAQVGDLVNGHASSVGIAWLNDATGAWQTVGQQPGTADLATAGLWHFSNYIAYEE